VRYDYNDQLRRNLEAASRPTPAERRVIRDPGTDWRWYTDVPMMGWVLITLFKLARMLFESIFKGKNVPYIGDNHNGSPW
jgi:ribose/xylose/arabinose/galactoside ABC-type transport system permease subunit